MDKAKLDLQTLGSAATIIFACGVGYASLKTELANVKESVKPAMEQGIKVAAMDVQLAFIRSDLEEIKRDLKAMRWGKERGTTGGR